MMKILVAIGECLLLASCLAHAKTIKVCDQTGSTPANFRSIQLTPTSTSQYWKLAELRTGLPTVVAVQWGKKAELLCIDLVQGTEIDVMEALPSIISFAPGETAVAPIREVIRIQSPPRKRWDLDVPKIDEGYCTAESNPKKLTQAGIAFMRTNLDSFSLQCFEKAARLDGDNLVAHLGVVRLGGMAKVTEENLRKHCERIAELEPLLREYCDFRIALLPFAYGRPADAVSRLRHFLSFNHSLHYDGQASSSFVQQALNGGLLQDALLGQARLVENLIKRRNYGSEVVTAFSLIFAHERLGTLRESSGDFAGALAAFSEALKHSDNDVYSFPPDLGRIRALRKLNRANEIGTACRTWRSRIVKPSFDISYKRDGGLALAKARIDLSCGEEKRGLATVASVARKMPNWDEPIRVLRDHLLSLGEWEKAQVAEKEADRAKSKMDNEALGRIFADVERLMPKE